MTDRLIYSTISAGLFLFFAQMVYANPADNARVLEDKAISYAQQNANESTFEIKIAAHDLSQDAMMLGKSYSQSYGLRDISSAECLAEVTMLGSDSETYTQIALAGKYKTIVVNGNIVMLIASSAGTLTYTVLDQGNYCNIEKSIHDAYWSAHIFRLALAGINIAFS